MPGRGISWRDCACHGPPCCPAHLPPPSLNTAYAALPQPCAQVHANCRIRRIYFSDRLYSEAELPPEFKVGGWGAVGAPAGRLAAVACGSTGKLQ